MAELRFAKMSGAGNDFILLDNRSGQIANPDPQWIKKLCTRRLSVGADGLMLLETSAQADFAMRYYNADGSAAAMCGNGGRCLARFAVLLGMAAQGQPLSFLAPSGRYRAVVEGMEVRLDLIPPQRVVLDVPLKLSAGQVTVDSTNTGVPHAVVFTPDVDQTEVVRLGREIRSHPYFGPAGTNANFCQVVDDHRLRIRTYERGVEDETLACGTGVAAAALAAAQHGWVQSPVAVETRGGAVITMTFTSQHGAFTAVQQQGEARLIYWGELADDAIKF